MKTKIKDADYHAKTYGFLRVFLILSVILLGFGNKAWALNGNELAEFSNSFKNGYKAFKDGYIDMEFMIYNDNDRDKWITNAYIDLYAKKKGDTKFSKVGCLLHIYNQKQGDDNWYWARLNLVNEITSKVTTSTNSGEKEVTYSAADFRYTKRGSITYANIRAYFSPEVLLEYQGCEFQMFCNGSVDKNNDGEGASSFPSVYTLTDRFPTILEPEITTKLSNTTCGNFEIVVTDQNSSGSLSYNNNYFYYTDKISHTGNFSYNKPTLRDAIANPNFDENLPITIGNVPYVFTYQYYTLVPNPDYDKNFVIKETSTDYEIHGTTNLIYDAKTFDQYSTLEEALEYFNDSYVRYVSYKTDDSDTSTDPDNPDDPTDTNPYPEAKSKSKYLVKTIYKVTGVENNKQYNSRYDVSFSNEPYVYDLVKSFSKTTFTPDERMGKVNSKTGTFTYPFANTPQTIYVYYYVVISQYQEVLLPIEVKLDAYQFPESNRVFLTDELNGATKITFNIDQYVNQIEGDEFELIRSNDASFSTYSTVADIDKTLEFVSGKKEYSIIDNTGEYNYNSPIYYRIRRTKTKNVCQWSYYTQVSTNKTMQHINVKNGFVVFNDDPSNPNGVDITINLDQASNYDDENIAKTMVMTKNAKIILVRKDLTSSLNTKLEIPITFDDKGNYNITYNYKENITKACHEFAYTAYVKPGNVYYSDPTEIELPNQDPEESILAAAKGDIANLVASKGYFSDRIELQWEVTEGAFESYAIERKEYDQPEDKYRLVANAEGSPSSQKILYSDLTALTGTVYSYRITGKSTCATAIVESTSKLSNYGFRTSTGDFYGRTTFKNTGAGEPGVEINVEPDNDKGLINKAAELTSSQTITVNNNQVLSNATSALTFQTWIKPQTTSGEIFSKEGMYKVELNGGKVKFTVGSTSVSSNSTIASDRFTHVSAVKYADSISIYINGKWDNSIATSANVTGNNNQVVFGENFAGTIDEIRIWSRALDSLELANDYNRYIIGNEKNLELYYNFNYCFDDEIFDMSYVGSDYNQNDAKFDGKFTSNTVSRDQLWYRAITDEAGYYSLRGVPYVGNGTSYIVTAKLGIHNFENNGQVKFLCSTSTNYTVNFEDNSSFKVTGTVMYEGGTFPVEGAMFYIDNNPVIGAKGTYVLSNSEGKFEIDVPIGTHEVLVYKRGHEFVGEGKITNSDGSDRNYQDEISGIELFDKTRIKYVGRVCGGNIQEELPLGFSLSKNNLSNQISISLNNPKAKDANYHWTENETAKDEFTYDHQKLSSQNSEKIPGQTKVVYTYQNDNQITIFPDVETGEFVAYIPPEKFEVKVNIAGYEDRINKEEVDFSQCVSINDKSTYKYIDSIEVKGQYYVQAYSDTCYYNKKQIFAVRNTPQISIKQVSESGDLLDYYGKKDYEFVNTLGEKTTIQIFNPTTKEYTFKDNKGVGLPVFSMDSYYTFELEAFEGYTYYKDGVKTEFIDKVPTADAKVTFNNTIANGNPEPIELDSLGKGRYTFQVGKPELTEALRQITAQFYYGTGVNATAIPWENAWGSKNGDAIVLGSTLTGTNFTTAGPDKLLTVLRDPPGSNSYTYLEKGYSFKSSSKVGATITNEGTDGIGTGNASHTETVNLVGGIGASSGVSTTELEFENSAQVGVHHKEEQTGDGTFATTITTTTKFQTSDDPLYVGADGDVYVGYSTNITFGSTNDVVAMPTNLVDPSKFTVYFQNDELGYSIVKKTGIALSQSFNTLFAYTQTHIENVLIPTLEDNRVQLLETVIPEGYTFDSYKEKLQELANTNKRSYYLSKVDAEDENFGQDGYYAFIFDQHAKENPVDQVHSITQSIKNWYHQLSENDRVKLEAKKNGNNFIQNFSFQAGASVEYEEGYTYTQTNTSTTTIVVGATTEGHIKSELFGILFQTNIEESIDTEMHYEYEDETEQSIKKGFVLKEDGDDDYLSVDVYRENGRKDDDFKGDNDNFFEHGDRYGSFIFITKGGVTSCPYEKEYKASHYKGHEDEVIQVATVQLEKPEIKLLDGDTRDFVPTGEKAYFKIGLLNNSESNEDVYYFLSAPHAANLDGAIIKLDGDPIADEPISILCKAGEMLQQTITVEKGSVLNYDGLELVLRSQCQSDPTSFLDVIADTARFNVHFAPSCTDINIKEPSNNWVYNTKLDTANVEGKAEPQHYLNVLLDNFDVNYDSFDHIEIQYKSSAASENDWTTVVKYYNDEELLDQALEKDPTGNIYLIKDKLNTRGEIAYKLFFDEMSDRVWDLRAVAYCNINEELIPNYSEVAEGIKDMYQPRLFGNPSPANGVLTSSDEIKITFNESIWGGYITDNNFQITGVRNGAKTDHSTSIRFDGKSSSAYTEFDRNLANKDFTIELWYNPVKSQDAVLFSHGVEGNSMQLKLNSNDTYTLSINGQELKSEDKGEASKIEKEGWNHVAVSVSKDGKTNIYHNFSPVLSNVEIEPYGAKGKFVLGADLNNSINFDGCIDNARIWTSQKSATDIQLQSTIQLSGSESYLLDYYPMDEGKGTATADKARSVNLVLKNCEWELPAGYSYQFNGTNSYIEMPSGSASTLSNADFAVECWFKAEKGQSNATILGNGKGDGSEENESFGLFNINIDNGAKLEINHNGYNQKLSGEYVDGQWHHICYTVSRTNGRAYIYVDGLLDSYFVDSKVMGIANGKLYAGARVYMDENNSEKADNFFNGMVDEIRIWNLYRSEQILANKMNEKLQGDEMGLLLYYPFEHYITWQGTQELNSTLEGKSSIDLFDKNEAKVVGGAQASKDKAPVKDLGQISKLNFTYVYSDDAIVINLTEEADRIEGTIVTFTVSDIFDLHGNPMLNPVTWTAYIDRNQLTWDEDAIELEKAVYEPLEFTVGISNKGGSYISYKIDNLPSWLSVSPEKGEISPVSEQNIKFTVDEGLKVGTYNETVYLTNTSNNVSEALDIQLTVDGQNPKWEVNPANFEFNMSVFGKMRFNGVFSTDSRDMLAAFYNDQCVGVANCMYDKQTDFYYVLIPIYNKAQQGGKISFKLYQASTGMVFEAYPSQNIYFKNNAIIGNVVDPIIFDALDVKFNDIELNAKWNWISFNLFSEDLKNINSTLGTSNWTANDVIKSKSSNCSFSAINHSWLGSLKSLENTSMYMIYTQNPKTLSYKGTNVDVAKTPITAKAKQWTSIGYLPKVDMTVENALAGYEAQELDVIKSQEGFSMYYRNNWIGSLTYMQVGKGYMLYNGSSENKSFCYPSSASLVSKKAAVSNTQINYAENMNIVASADCSKDAKLYAYADGKQVAQSNVIEVEDQKLMFITVSGDNTVNNITFVLSENGNNLIANNVVKYQSNAIAGNLENPILLDFSDAIEVEVYPTVVSKNINIKANVSDYKVEVIDINGRMVIKAENLEEFSMLNASNLKAGVYIVKITLGDKVVTKKIVKY